jgi:glycine betaine/proline transport system substrate-binding protein
MKRLITSLAIVLTIFLCTTHAFAAEKIRFGVPPWPGVEVKTQVVRQILETIGYPTEELQIGPPIIYKGLVSDDVDAFVAAWIPQQNSFLDPLLAKKAVEVVQTNLDNARISLCVPRFVADAGVTSFADLAPNADKFEHKIHNIEVGTGMYNTMEEIIANDAAGLGDWKQVGATTSAMLMEVKSRIKEGKWVTFGCWQPHWMNLDIDMAYLDPIPGTEKFANQSRVDTVVSLNMKTRHPQAYRVLKNMIVPTETQSRWIMEYGQMGKPAEQVASQWIANNKDIVARWLDGVRAADGSDAMKKINEKFN